MLLIALLAILPLAAQAVEKYHMVLVPDPSLDRLQVMAELGLPLDDARTLKGRGLEIPLSESDLARLRDQGVPFTVTQEDLGKHWETVCLENLRQIPALAGVTDTDPVHMKYGSMGGFYTFQQIVADLDSMRLLYPNLCTQKVSVGQGWNNNPLWMVKISDNPDIDEDEPEAFFDALHHAREPGSYTATLYSMWWLLENYGTDPEATYLINNRELFFVPVANPDGLLYNQQIAPNGGGTWRKNRRNNGTSYGVDLNRNYPYQWGYDNIGSSATPSSETYRGPSAGSEPETQALMNFINGRSISTAMTVHTASNVYICAYGYANVLPEHYDVHLDYMSYAARLNGYDVGTCYSIMYASNGRTQDWQLHQHDIINVEPEIGSHGFWPALTYIMPEARENLDCFLNQFWCAGGQVVMTALDVQDGYLEPGQTENLIATVFNRGWGTSEAITFAVSTMDPYVSIGTVAAGTGPLARRTSATNATTPFVAQVSPTCPLGHEVDFITTVDQGGYIRTDTLTLMVGVPTVLFQDGAEAGMGNWTVTGNWGVTSSNPHSGQYSFNDSPSGNYTNNATWTMTKTAGVSLAGASQAWLDFWARWSIETNYDFVQVEVSTNNGATWTPIAGQYTVAGSGIGVQPSGQPGYEGSQGTWVHETMSLDAYLGQTNLKFRFELRSDGGVVGDGFFVDDLKLLAFTQGPPPVPNVQVTLTPVGAPIQIPPGGGQFTYNAQLQNLSGAFQTANAWIMQQIPAGTWQGPMLGPVTIDMPAGANVTRSRFQNVPSTAAPGTYTYVGYVGQYTSGVKWDSSYFTYTKLSGDGEAMVHDWACTGEPFPGELVGTSFVAFLPEEVALSASPNPFNPETAIGYQ
ncbi:MAG: hypothetical protein C4524_10300, partial [Candidatus Zixiibacteriota bacterium]